MTEALGESLTGVVQDALAAPQDPFLPVDYPDRTYLPVVSADFYAETAGTDAEQEISGQHYAWPNILRWMNQRHESRANTSGDVVYVDLCSAFPIHAELIDSRLFTFGGVLASRLVAFGSAELFKEHTDTEDEELVANLPHIRQSISSQKRPSGQLLRAAIQRVVYKLQPGDVDFSDKTLMQSTITAMLAYELHNNTEVYQTENGSETYEKRMNIHTTAHNLDRTFLEELSDIALPTQAARDLRKQVGPVVVAAVRRNGVGFFEDIELHQDELFASVPLGEARAEAVAQDIAQFFAARLVYSGYARPQRVISVDLADADALLEDAPKSFDREHQDSGLFARTCQRVQRGTDHWQMDIFSDDLERLPNESVTMFTIFDGFPFYFGENSMTDIPQEARRKEWLSFADRLYRKLQPGGHLLIFPWDVKDMTENDQHLLDDMIRYWLDYEPGTADKPEVATKKYLKRTLQSWMQPLEMKLSEHSPILQVDDPNHIFEALLMVKSGVSNRRQAMQRRIRVAPDPTQ